MTSREHTEEAEGMTAEEDDRVEAEEEEVEEVEGAEGAEEAAEQRDASIAIEVAISSNSSTAAAEGVTDKSIRDNKTEAAKGERTAPLSKSGKVADEEEAETETETEEKKS
jgi:beta-phosphoglucomutase-like phosphatase (HAD superfamily)